MTEISYIPLDNTLSEACRASWVDGNSKVTLLSESKIGNLLFIEDTGTEADDSWRYAAMNKLSYRLFFLVATFQPCGFKVQPCMSMSLTSWS